MWTELTEADWMDKMGYNWVDLDEMDQSRL